MSEYIEHLTRDDSMISNVLRETLEVKTGGEATPEVPDIVITCGEQGVSCGITSFSLDFNGCEIVVFAGVEKFKKLQEMHGKSCNVTFHNFNEMTTMVSYTLTNNLQQNLVTLKFARTKHI
jgi:hypothetical protein